MDNESFADYMNLLGSIKEESKTIPEIVAKILNESPSIKYDVLRLLLSSVSDFRGLYFPESHLFNLIGKISSSRGYKKLLSIANDGGVTTVGLAENYNYESIQVFSPDQEFAPVESIISGVDLRLCSGNFQTLFDVSTPGNDLIYFSPVIMGFRVKNRNSDFAETSMRDVPVEEIKSLAPLFTPDGMICVLLPMGFLSRMVNHNFAGLLEEKGLFVSAVIEVAPEFTKVQSDRRMELVIIQKQPVDAVFVGKLPFNEILQDQLVKRLINREEGGTIEQGFLVPLTEYQGLNQLKSNWNLKKYADRNNLSIHEFSEIVQEVNSFKRKGRGEYTPFDERDNTVYLPEMGRMEASVDQGDFPENFIGYLQLVIREDFVLPQYLAYWLNTPEGRFFREACMSGAMMQRITKASLMNSEIPLPDIEKQHQIVEIQKNIDKQKTELDEMLSAVWENPNTAAEVVESLKGLKPEESFAEWIETLPFTLASILRSYMTADATPKDKYERLLYFFEALSMFFATIHLSAFNDYEDQWEEVITSLKKVLSKSNQSLSKPTFGLWVNVVTTLGKVVRKEFNSTENDSNKILLQEMYSIFDQSQIDMLVSKKLFALLQKTNQLRNRLRGHSGSVNEKEAKERLDILEDHLQEARSIIGRSFNRYKLVYIDEMKLLPRGIFETKIRIAMGSNPQFERDVIKTTTPLENQALYMYSPGLETALKLIPFVRVEEVPQLSAYYYNHMTKRNPHYVSYHLTKQSTFDGTPDDIEEVIKRFEG